MLKGKSVYFLYFMSRDRAGLGHLIKGTGVL